MSGLGVESGSVDDVGFAARARPFVWGFVSQAVSSATNFGLSLVAGLVLGPTGLGRVFVGFSFYLLVLGFQRALIIDPLVSASSAVEGASRTEATRAAFMMCLLWGGISTIAIVAAAIIAPAGLGDGLFLFALWVGPALLQDFWRVILFREGRGKAAVANDVSWAVVMAITVPTVFWSQSAWVVVGTWGLGAVAGMTLGFFQTGIRPVALIPSVRWWRRDAWPFGKWLGAEGIVYTLGSQGLVFVLAFMLGARPLGGIRAVQTLFAPLTLLLPAISLPGLPEMSRRVASSAQGARRFALFLGTAATVLTGVYVLLGLAYGDRLLTLVFGELFRSFESLIPPVGVGQLLVASTIGVALLLKAQRRGKALLIPRLGGSLGTFGLAAGLAASYGVEGAAWGMAIGSAINSVLLFGLGAFTFGRRPERETPSAV
jgi:O-antigen/teichoic acid export membrane protein